MVARCISDGNPIIFHSILQHRGSTAMTTRCAPSSNSTPPQPSTPHSPSDLCNARMSESPAVSQAQFLSPRNSSWPPPPPPWMWVQHRPPYLGFPWTVQHQQCTPRRVATPNPRSHTIAARMECCDGVGCDAGMECSLSGAAWATGTFRTADGSACQPPLPRPVRALSWVCKFRSRVKIRYSKMQAVCHQVQT